MRQYVNNKRQPLRPHTVGGTKQQGITLIVTLIVLFVLTLLAVSSTSSNRLQSAMARNNQFQLEAFNSSYTEIAAQLNAINRRNRTAGIPTFITNLPETKENQVFTNIAALSRGVDNVVINSTITPSIRLKSITCLGEGASVGSNGSYDLILNSRTALHRAGQPSNQTGIVSEQRQRFGIQFLLGQKGQCTPNENVAESAPIP